ncbi:hypothetical protein E2C01_048795 [Portunus trituberculatus]|uniref:Uncharacterized protein n=1 Tax=Portunus trituberculatus TaxID=210409 RepID=A0A5B7GBG9_PORTR|nr:hypothetical protein [Portunus trituberculatus]
MKYTSNDINLLHHAIGALPTLTLPVAAAVAAVSPRHFVRLGNGSMRGRVAGCLAKWLSNRLVCRLAVWLSGWQGG